ncbi:MAG: hypothetical protein P8H58_03565 [Luminiphilus sp.]|nr:hypothetical protein [Luminiphilus sp.]
MNAALRLLVLLLGVLFLVMGLRWLLAPQGIAPDFGLALQSGVGLSSQIGDMAAFFLLLGICIFTALVTQRRFWYYPTMILLTLTALSRVLAWLMHDAALPMNLITPEIVVALVLWVASRHLSDRD